MDVEEAFKKKVSNIPLTIRGVISQLLADDHEGIHHQRFIVKLESGKTILVSHNLERGYREDIKIGDKVEVHGTYVWNKYGGLMHNTHHDDRDTCRKLENGNRVCGPLHEDGWVIFAGEKDPHRKVQTRT